MIKNQTVRRETSENASRKTQGENICMYPPVKASHSNHKRRTPCTSINRASAVEKTLGRRNHTHHTSILTGEESTWTKQYSLCGCIHETVCFGESWMHAEYRPGNTLCPLASLANISKQPGVKEVGQPPRQHLRARLVLQEVPSCLWLA